MDMYIVLIRIPYYPSYSAAKAQLDESHRAIEESQGPKAQRVHRSNVCLPGSLGRAQESINTSYAIEMCFTYL